ncbi:MAG: hypothetical protein JWO86_3169 [Myxococcaceae bacterium]|nr:hypothetical protein [Myxococcaceae bacterium]
MQAVARWRGIAFYSATLLACGHNGPTETVDASTAAGDASTGHVATRACSPLAPPSSLTLEAVTPDGHYLVGTEEPSTASSPAASHLFYGTPDHMAEATVTHAEVGCGWYPTFEVGAASYSAVIAYASCSNNVHSRIYVNGGDPQHPVVQVLTVLVLEGAPAADGGAPAATDAGAPATPAAFSYFCL